jgi:hypothetical protein
MDNPFCEEKGKRTHISIASLRPFFQMPFVTTLMGRNDAVPIRVQVTPTHAGYNHSDKEFDMSNFLLDAPLISRTRRNHGLEHATLHVLSQRFPNKRLGGHSSASGFFIVGDVSAEAVCDAALEALRRMQNGERRLAIHPGCGTNYVVTGVLSGLLAWLGMSGAKTNRERFERLPLVMTLSMLGLFISQPLAPVIQERVTTSGEPGSLTIEGVYKLNDGLHRVKTRF